MQWRYHTLSTATLVICTMDVVLPCMADCTWEPGPSFSAGPREFAAAVNQNGTIAVLGGRPLDGENAPVHYLAPGSSVWQAGASLDGPIMQPAAVVDSSGRILVIGGYVTSDHYPFFLPLAGGVVYDWNDGSGARLAAMHMPRAMFAWTSDDQHRAYLIGGLDVTRAVSDAVERYDPVTNEWHILAPLPQPRQLAAAVHDGRGHILLIGGGGASGLSRAEVFSYDIAADEWTGLASQPVALKKQVAVLANDGRIYVLGGDAGSIATTSVYVFDPTTGEWSTGPSMGTARSGAAAVVGNTGLLFVLGGRSGSLSTKTVEWLTVSDCTACTGTADCLDACPNDPNKTEAGLCGCGVADTDADDDGVADCLDECPNTPVGAEADAHGCPVPQDAPPADPDPTPPGAGEPTPEPPSGNPPVLAPQCGMGISETMALSSLGLLMLWVVQRRR